MTRTAASVDELWDEARGFASSVAITAAFAAIYVVAAPIVLLGALAGGPLWAAIVLAREQALESETPENGRGPSGGPLHV